MTGRLFRSFLVHPIDDPDQARRAQLIATATAVTALYLVGITLLYAVGGQRTAMLIALSVAVLAALTHALARTGRLPAMELATAALAAYGALALLALQGQHSARLGALLLERTLPLIDEFEVVREVRGLGLMWAIEFAEPRAGRLSWRLIERMQKGLFAQLVVGPLFSKHRILTQVAGHNMAVVKVLPPLVLSDGDVEYFADALRSTIASAQHMPMSLTKFALAAAGAGVRRD